MTPEIIGPSTIDKYKMVDDMERANARLALTVFNNASNILAKTPEFASAEPIRYPACMSTIFLADDYLYTVNLSNADLEKDYTTLS